MLFEFLHFIQVKYKENGIDETLPNFMKIKHPRNGEKKK
jgi:hypothetical protein